MLTTDIDKKQPAITHPAAVVSSHKGALDASGCASRELTEVTPLRNCSGVHITRIVTIVLPSKEASSYNVHIICTLSHLAVT